MRELHAIGLTPDGQHLLLAADRDAARPSHRIAVDQHFEAVLRGQRVDDATSGPNLSVQDMQARLRSGATVVEVAAAAGLPVSRVERFAGPVLSEREAVLRKVFAAHQTGRRGSSILPLARAVAIALEDVANIRLDTVEWTAYRKADGVWVARVSVLARGRARRAEWSLDDLNRTVRPLDAWASSLGHVDDTAGPSGVPTVAKKPTPRPGTAKTTPVTPRKAAAAGAVTAKAVPRKVAAKTAGKAAPAKTAGKAAPAKTAGKAAAKTAPAKAGRTGSTKATPVAKASPRKAARPGAS